MWVGDLCSSKEAPEARKAQQCLGKELRETRRVGEGISHSDKARLAIDTLGAGAGAASDRKTTKVTRRRRRRGRGGKRGVGGERQLITSNCFRGVVVINYVQAVIPYGLIIMKKVKQRKSEVTCAKKTMPKTATPT